MVVQLRLQPCQFDICSPKSFTPIKTAVRRSRRLPIQPVCTYTHTLKCSPMFHMLHIIYKYIRCSHIVNRMEAVLWRRLDIVFLSCRNYFAPAPIIVLLLLLNTRTLFIYVVHPCLRYIPGIRQGFTRERNTSVYITCIMLPRAGSYGLHSLRYRSLNPLTCTTVRVYRSCTTYRKGRVGSRYQSRIVIISDVRHREDHY